MKISYPRNIRFKCIRCAICCGDTENRARTILMLKIEVDKIAEKTSVARREFAEKIEGFEPYVYRMRKTTEGKCLFLEGKTCSIYAIRPIICRFYPFELKNKGSNRCAFTATDECPAIGTGPQLKDRYFKKLFDGLTDLMEKNARLIHCKS